MKNELDYPFQGKVKQKTDVRNEGYAAFFKANGCRPLMKCLPSRLLYGAMILVIVTL